MIRHPRDKGWQVKAVLQEMYNIYFSGDIAEGEALEDVRRRVGALFNAREATLDKLFSGRKQLIKRNCSHEEALKYRDAMRRAGALATLAPADSTATTDPTANASQGAPDRHPPDPADSRSGAAGESQGPAGFSLAPAGTEVLLPTERHTPADATVALPAFTVAPAGERLAEPRPAAPPPPDTSHISDSEIGDALPGLSRSAPPSPPDTSGLSLAEVAAGLLEERFRNHDHPAPPATDHLSVESTDHE